MTACGCLRAERASESSARRPPRGRLPRRLRCAPTRSADGRTTITRSGVPACRLLRSACTRGAGDNTASSCPAGRGPRRGQRVGGLGVETPATAVDLPSPVAAVHSPLVRDARLGRAGLDVNAPAVDASRHRQLRLPLLRLSHQARGVAVSAAAAARP